MLSDEMSHLIADNRHGFSISEHEMLSDEILRDEMAHLIAADNRHGFLLFQNMTGRSSLQPPVTPL